jgi:hypothetical protein
MSEIVEVKKDDKGQTTQEPIQEPKQESTQEPKPKSKKGLKGSENLKKWREKLKANNQEQNNVIKSESPKPKRVVKQKKKYDMTLVILGILGLILALGLSAFFLIPSFKQLVMSKIKAKKESDKNEV